MDDKDDRQGVVTTNNRQGPVENQDTIFIGRQPILDKRHMITGFELLFRTAECLDANVCDQTEASVETISNFLNIGLQDLIGTRNKGYLNVGREVLLSDILELVPKDRMIIELLETVVITPEIVDRCRELKSAGYCLALDDFIYEPAYDPLLEIVDIVKVDLLQMTPSSLRDTVERLKRYPVKLLAEKVEDQNQYKEVLSMGFELFQGYYFAKPTLITGKRLDPSRIAVLKLLEQVLVETEVGEIEKTFKENPHFTYNLLRIVNSVGMGISQNIESVRQAIVLLGRDQIKRWAQLLLFSDKNSSGGASPLMQTAAKRGRLMELLAEKSEKQGSSNGIVELAFMTGILSLIDALLGKPLEEVISQLSLAEEAQSALLAREGELGKLLTFTENLEQGDMDGVSALLAGGKLEISHLLAAEQEAIAWTNKLVDSF